MTFATELVGTTSPAQSITLSNYGTTTVNITGITVTTDFGETDNCGSSLVSGASCTVNVTSTPTATGFVTGTLSVTDSAPGTPQTVSLSGSGTTSNLTLTGYCFGTPQGSSQCQTVKDLAECPAGQLAISPTSATCVGRSDTEDTSRGCHPGGPHLFLGSCEVK
jgi:hypothetical protein